RAISSPRPREAPVTRATCPDRSARRRLWAIAAATAVAPAAASSVLRATTAVLYPPRRAGTPDGRHRPPHACGPRRPAPGTTRPQPRPYRSRLRGQLLVPAGSRADRGSGAANAWVG